MNAWNTLYGEGLKVRYHVYLAEENADTDLVDIIQISFTDGYELTVRYYPEEQVLVINYNGNKITLYTIDPSFTYLHILEEVNDAEELAEMIRHEISYLLSSVLS